MHENVAEVNSRSELKDYRITTIPISTAADVARVALSRFELFYCKCVKQLIEMHSTIYIIQYC